MTAAEKTMALLCCDLGDGQKPLSPAEFKTLSELVKTDGEPPDAERDLTADDLSRIGYANPERILKLLERPLTEKLGSAEACIITRLSPQYPQRLLISLGADAPAVLYYNGDASLFAGRHISLVGMRECSEEGLDFAAAVGEIAADEGYTLVSGGAKGADSAAETAALGRGGRVISFITSPLTSRLGEPNVKNYILQGNLMLVCSQYPYLSFSANNALIRNKYIHAISDKVFVSDCGSYTGGTWSGTTANIKNKWSDIYVFDNGTQGNEELIKRGCKAISIDTIRSAISL